MVTISATKPSWLDLSGNVLSGTPTNSDVGLHNVTITATDSGGLSATQSFMINVENVNDAPTFTSTPITAATEDVGYSYTPQQMILIQEILLQYLLLVVLHG